MAVAQKSGTIVWPVGWKQGPEPAQPRLLILSHTQFGRSCPTKKCQPNRPPCGPLIKKTKKQGDPLILVSLPIFASFWSKTTPSFRGRFNFRLMNPSAPRIPRAWPQTPRGSGTGSPGATQVWLKSHLAIQEGSFLRLLAPETSYLRQIHLQFSP